MFQIRKGPYCPANEWVHCWYISCKEVYCFVLFCCVFTENILKE